MTVTMVTTIDDESVLYEVYTGRAMDGDFNDGHQVWQKEVPFGMGERFRAGGAAFVAAAREQAQIAESYALMPFEPNEYKTEAVAIDPKVEAAIGFLSAPERERILERLGYNDAEIAAYFRARGEAALPCLQPREGL